MYKLLRKLFDIRREEAPRALLMFAYLFLVIASLLIVKPVRNALFLDVYDVEQLPYVFILVALAAAVVTTLYSRFSGKVSLHRLIQGTLVFVISNLLCFWGLLQIGMESGWFVYLFYVWVAIFAVIATSQFWILANYIFNAREARRLFGFIGAGGISGGIAGGYLSNLAPLIGTDNLLLICVLFLGVCLVLVQSVWSLRQADPQAARERETRRSASSRASRSGLLRRSRLLLYLAGIVGVSVLVANLVDYQYNAVVEASISDTDQRTAFFGFWLSNLSIVSLGIQLFLTRRILGRFGVGPSMFFLPLGILVGAVAILFSPVLWAAILIKVSDGSFKQSINKAAMELLVLPIPPDIKPQAKSFIDVFVDSFATGLGGLLLILFTAGLGFSTGQISLVVIAFIAVWISLLVAVRREYVEAFRVAIERRSIDPGEESINLEDASLFQGLLQRISGDNERQILYVLQLLENVQNEMFLPYLERLLDHPSADIRAQVLRMLPAYSQVDFSAKVESLVGDPVPEVRVLSIDYLLMKLPPEKQEAFLRRQLDHPDLPTRAAALRCLGRTLGEHPDYAARFNLKGRVEEELQLARSAQTSPELQEFLKLNLASLAGEARQPELSPLLAAFFNDDTLAVRKQAIESAGEIRAEEFIDALIALLPESRLRKTVRNTLARYGRRIIPRLHRELSKSATPRKIRNNIPRILALTGEQEAVDVLLQHLDVAEPALRYEVLRSLNRLRKNFPALQFPRRIIEEHLKRECENYRELGRFHRALSESWTRSSGPDDGYLPRAQTLLLKALKERRHLTLDRVFRLLGLLYRPGDMYSAYLGVISTRPGIRSNALEFLDNVLDHHLKGEIIAAVEAYHQRHFSPSPAPPDVPSCLCRLLEWDDWWLAACTVFTVAHLEDNGRYRRQIDALTSSANPFLRETAKLARRQAGSGA